MHTNAKIDLNDFKQLTNHAFHYNSSIAYENLQQINIGKMNIICNYCNALRFPGESKNMCCSSGRVCLPQSKSLPEPLQSLLNNTHEKSKTFLPFLRKYNACFNMTSFRTSGNAVKPEIFTFKVQGQIYHQVGSLIAENENDAEFLQIYFMGNEEEEVRKRKEIVPDTDIQLLRELQNMLHNHNEYIKIFKTAMDFETNNDFQVIIKANRRPVGGHARVFNSPLTNEVAIIIDGSEFERRDILLKKNQMKFKI